MSSKNRLTQRKSASSHSTRHLVLREESGRTDLLLPDKTRMTDTSYRSHAGAWERCGQQKLRIRQPLF